MTKEQASGLVSSLETQFARDYPLKAKEMLLIGLENLPYEAGRKAYTNLIAEEKFLPAPALVTKMVSEWSAEIREQQANKERRENASHQSFVDKVPATEHGKRAIQLVRATLAGMDRNKVLEGMHHLAKMNPSAGWATEAARLQKYYEMKRIL